MNEIVKLDPIGNLLGTWSQELGLWSIIFKIIIALILGSIIGTERSTKRHAAGLRTFILVVLGGTITMLLDSYFASLGMGIYLLSTGCIIGVAIMSSNTTIYTSRSQIKGLTTQVALWLSGIIGLTIGCGLYTATLVAFIGTMAALSLFPKFEKYLKNRSNFFEVHLELKSATYLKDFVTTIRKLGLFIDDIESNPAYINSGLSVYSISISIRGEEIKKYKTHKEIIEALSSLEYVNHIEEMN